MQCSMWPIPSTYRQREEEREGPSKNDEHRVATPRHGTGTEGGPGVWHRLSENSQEQAHPLLPRDHDHPSVTISYFFFRNSQQTLEKNMIDTSVNNLAYTVTLIDKQLENAAHLSDWLFMNKNLDIVLTKEYPGPELGYDADIEAFLELKDYQLRSNVAIGTYVYSVLIIGKNGVDLRAGQPEGTHIDIAELQQEEWFQYGMSLQGKKSWYGIVENPSAVKYEKYIIPLVRPVFHSTTHQEIGWHMIGLRVSLISDLFKGLEIRPDETLIVVDPRGYAVYHSDRTLIGHNLGGIDYVPGIVSESALQGNSSATIEGEQRHITLRNRNRRVGASSRFSPRLS